jgi:prepilin-type N-terminal cleavage/methylation domain-containing protein
MKRAFTLIELLVVIAIIAILAAILFPVFAQAKAAAKATASISNDKQILLAQLQYAADSDDTAVVAQQWTPEPIAPASLKAGSSYYTLWPTLVQPYLKTLDIMSDPAGPGWKTRSNRGWTAIQSQSVMTNYGYNLTAWSPFPLEAPYGYRPVSMTSVERPAETVMTAASMVNYMDSKLAMYWNVDGKESMISLSTVDSPACWTWRTSLCIDGWGNSYYWNEMIGTSGGDVVGTRTGGVSMRVGRQGVLGFGDGHVKRMSLSRAAQGTNWTPDILPWDVQVTDESKYLWGPH